MRQILSAGVALALLASGSHALAKTRTCAATASFQGGSATVELVVDDQGQPTTGSRVDYAPAGSITRLQAAFTYPLSGAHQLGRASGGVAAAIVDPKDGDGQFVLTVGRRQYRSEGGFIQEDVPGHGSAEQVSQEFKVDRSLSDALAAGGSARLEFLSGDQAIASTVLSLAPQPDLQDAVNKAYAAAQGFAADARHSPYCQ
jgi:hypothetical protein